MAPLTVQLFIIPKNATNETPAPAVINNHGNTSTTISILPYGIEQARRGYVVLLVDMAGRGSSEFGNGNVDNSIAAWVKYCLDAPYIDSDHLNITGFSMSGSKINVLYPYAEHFDSAMAFSSGGPRDLTADIPVNFLAVRGSDDDLVQFDENGNIKEALLFAENSGIEDFEMNNLYGNFENKTARMYYLVDGMIHIAGTFYREPVSVMLDFLQKSSPAPKPIDPNNTVYLIKDWAGLVAMCLIIGLILSLVSALLKLNVFQSIVSETPPNIGLRKGGWILSAVLAVIVPLLIFSTVTNKQPNWFPIGNVFKFALPNGIMIFLMCLVILSIVMGCLFHFTEGIKKGASLHSYGLTNKDNPRLNWSIIGRSFGMAVFIVATIVILINTVNMFLGTEYSWWVLDFSSFNASRIKDSVPYMIPYCVAFATSSFGMNVERRLPETGNGKLDAIKTYVINVVLNMGGILIIVIVNLVSAAMSPINKQAIGGGLYSLFAWGMVFAMSYIAIINTYCYRKTGTIWLGLFINALMVPLMLCNGVPYGALVTVSGTTENAAFGFAPIVGGALITLFLAALIYFSLPKKKHN